MRLKSLYIEKYKNLHDLDLNFEAGQGLTMLIGNNGSGKSNVLEALSAIFHDSYKPSEKTYLGKKNKYNSDYIIEYEKDGKNIKISRCNDIRKFYVDGAQKAHYQFLRESYLPHNVIGVYSGEDSRLWSRFYEPYYKNYIRRIVQGFTEEQMKLFFINKYYWNIALLVLLISQNETLVPFLQNELGIVGDVKIIFAFDMKQVEQSNNPLLRAFIEHLNPDMSSRLTLGTLEISSRLYEQYEVDSVIFQYFVQASMPKNDKIITSIEIIFNNGLSTEALSEGEKKLILIKATLEFLADERTIILLDEPDAHVHEARKNSLYKMLTEYTNRQIVMTSHSPTFIDIAKDNEIIMLKRDENNYATIFNAGNLEKIRHLTGSRFNAFIEKPILYCEGTETSIEAKLYPMLFPKYKIISSGGHEEVIHNTKMYNTTFGENGRYAIGIIDCDYKTDDQIKALMDSGIYSLSVAEIENVLMDASLLIAAKDQFFAADDCIEKAKQKFFDECRKSTTQEYQAIKFTSNYIISKIKSSLNQETRDIEVFKQHVSDICKIEEIDRLYSERRTEMRAYVEGLNYEKLVAVFDFHHNIDRFLKDIVNDYCERIIRLIEQNEELKNHIKKKYYPDVPLVD